MTVFHIECVDVQAPVPLSSHMMGCLVTFVVVALVDVVLRLLFPDQKTRWFALHFVANMIISAMCLHDMWGLMKAPLCAFSEASDSWVPSYIAFGLHAYHLIAFTAVRMEDIVHHVLFAGGLAVFNFLMVWGRMTNTLLFFMTGFPGGVDYLMLVLVKTGRIERITQKKMCSFINTWCRVPGHVATTTIFGVCAAHGTTKGVHLACVGVVASLCLLNGLYYGEQAIGTFHRMAVLSPTHADKANGMASPPPVRAARRPRPEACPAPSARPHYVPPPRHRAL
jgi:hypothetical protein